MTSQQILYINSSIAVETGRYNLLSTADDKFQCLNNIISLKKLVNYSGHDSIYLDFKKYVKLYIEAVEEKDSGYDNIDVQRISSKLADILIIDQINILKFFKKTLLINGYPDEASECECVLQKLRISFYKANKNFKNYCKLVALWSSLSIKRLFILLLVFYIATVLLLIPAYFESLELFKVNYTRFSENQMLNHLLNVLTLFFDLSDNTMKVEAQNGFALILIILSKIIYITILVNFLAKKLIDFIKINE
ncbi:hypothetical protein [Pedobacter terrae]|uniref:hypothetical protein n=1 Tax=Pedobacter terrae TaxID=405671 RepID=UPI002FFA67B4